MAHPGWTVVLALGLGMVCQVVARYLKVPGIVLLLLAGVLAGPETLNLVKPDDLGDSLHTLVGLAVSVILFEGGLNLQIGKLRQSATVIRRLITVGALITGLGGAITAHEVMGWDWRVAILFGTLVIVTGPTVVTPLLRRIRVKGELHTILEAEGVLIDPIGAIIAVVTLEATLSATVEASVPAALLDLGVRLGFGLLLGFLGGLFLGLLLRYELIPEGLEKVMTLSAVLVLFEGSNLVLKESGIMTVTIAGLVVGNMESHLTRELQEFKEELTVMLIGMLFVLLAADVGMGEVFALGMPGLLTVAALMLIVRPLNVFLCTLGQDLSFRDKLFLSWIAPRGIVAAAVASIFAHWLVEANYPAGTQLEALVFSVIGLTVTIQGLTGGMVASLLGVRRPQDNGFVIFGANPVARAVGHALEQEGEEVVLIDMNPEECRVAREEGLTAILGNADDEDVLMQADVAGRRGIVGATPNEGLNFLLVQHVRRHFQGSEMYVSLQRGKAGATAKQIEVFGATVLFGASIDDELWYHRVRKGTVLHEVWDYGENGAEEAGPKLGDGFGPEENILLPLVLAGEKRPARPIDGQVRVRVGERVHFLVHDGHRTEAHEWLRAEGWELQEEKAIPASEPPE